MSTIESACASTPQLSSLRIEKLPFALIPNQSKLFLDYLSRPLSLRRFFPSVVENQHEVARRKSEVLSAYSTDRTRLCDSLERLNVFWGAKAQTVDNINRLRGADCVAVVSGQQVGLFTGPLYTVYKALSAIKVADCLSQRGVEAVPVFWLATEDHDWEEVRFAEYIGCDGRTASTSLPPELHPQGASVGMVMLDESIEESIGQLMKSLPSSEFVPTLTAALNDSYKPGHSFGEACARFMTHLTGHHGLILLDPLDSELKRLAAPLYYEAALKGADIALALEVRSRELEEQGYHAQVLANSKSFPLFLNSGQERHALHLREDGRYAVKGREGEEAFTVEEIARAAGANPERFSPNVTLRSVVQDFLLPTITYLGGSAEIAYFGQTSEVYRVLQRPVTPIQHRASMTIVDRRTTRTLERYGLNLADFFAGPEAVGARVVENHLGAGTARLFDRAESSIDAELRGLQNELAQFDPTLAESMATARRKIEYQLQAQRTRFHRARLNRDEATRRQIERALAVLYPGKDLQERHINIVSMMARHGLYIVEWMYEAIDLNSVDHQVVYL